MKTLIPGLASFSPWAEVRQPYSWTWTGRDRSFVKNWIGGGDGHWNTLCTRVIGYTGGDVVGWDTEAAYPSPEGWTVPSILHGNRSHTQVQAELAVGHGRGTHVTTVTDYDSDDGLRCGDSGSGEAQMPGYLMVTEGVGGAEMWRETITLVADGVYEPPDIGTATFNLTRREYARN